MWLTAFFSVSGQNTASQFILQGDVTAASDGEPLIGVNVTELDPTNRVVSGTVTDVNGHYILKVKSPSNRIAVRYLGYIKQELPIANRKVINISLKEESIMISQVVVTGSKKYAERGFSIPKREVGTAMQTIDAKEFEGLQVTSLDEALQGRIAGLEIVANSGDPGSGTSMRIRGVTSINGSSEPLIVLNGVPYSVDVDENFDYANSNQEQYANMLSINPDDILEITVLKDAAAAAIWGSRGANGVISVTTKKGTSGPVRLDYTYRFTRTVQPKGIQMLNGGDFTMLMKQAYLNPRLDDEATDIPEYNYDQNYPDYENYNNNTDWVNEVRQTGRINDHYITLSGGGERATYRISGGFFTQRGTLIGQELTRLSSRAYLDYAVSTRIKFISEFSLTDTDNDMNYENLLGIAYKKMPNVSVYEQDATGKNTNIFYNIPSSSTLDDDQKYLKNPVALAYLATNNQKSVRLIPKFTLQYDLVDPAMYLLRFTSNISFDLSTTKTHKFLPQEATNQYWTNTSVNRAEESVSEGMTLFSDNNLAYQPNFDNKDHSLLLYGSFQINTGNSAGQGDTKSSLPSVEAIDASNPGYLVSIGTSYSQWRSLAYMIRSHYAYKSRYIVDATFRREGSTKFGDENRYGNFPGVSLKWIVSDEPWMVSTKSWLSMLAFRPAWGISGNEPSSNYLSYSRYGTYGSYLGETAVRPVSLRLSNLKWETTSSFNYGIDLGLLDDKWVFDINFYQKRTEDMLFKNVAISSTSGYSSLPYINGGTMDNSGWELNLYGNQILSFGDWKVDFRFNLANYKNVLVKLDQSLLDSYNADFDYQNGSYLTMVKEGNSFGSIYGFRYKGVYTYDEYIAGEQECAPVARDAKGNVIYDQNGDPKPIYFAYGKDNQYRFRGGDAIYEDINHDGSIDELDIVYLGNCNPKITGGFGPTIRYKNMSFNLFFNFRYGNKIVNKARMNAENMYYDNNQSIAVNWRWRKDGDLTSMPRALHEYGYNWLGSDRFVEDGSFTRFKYLTFNYSVPSSLIKRYGLNRLNVYVTFNNLFVWTSYTGVDPEVGYDAIGLSYDSNQTPRTKDMTVGLSIGL